MTSDLGSLISDEHQKKVMGFVRSAVEDGGRILCGGVVPDMKGDLANGAWFEPTVIVDLDTSCKFPMEEVFGPVVVVHPFDTEEDAIELQWYTVWTCFNHLDTKLGACPPSGSRNGYGARLGQHMASSRFADTIWWNEKQRDRDSRGGISLDFYSNPQEYLYFVASIVDHSPFDLLIDGTISMKAAA